MSFISNIGEGLVSYFRDIYKLRDWVIENYSEEIYNSFHSDVHLSWDRRDRQYEEELDRKYPGVIVNGFNADQFDLPNKGISMRLESKKDFLNWYKFKEQK